MSWLQAKGPLLALPKHTGVHVRVLIRQKFIFTETTSLNIEKKYIHRYYSCDDKWNIPSSISIS